MLKEGWESMSSTQTMALRFEWDIRIHITSKERPLCFRKTKKSETIKSPFAISTPLSGSSSNRFCVMIMVILTAAVYKVFTAR